MFGQQPKRLIYGCGCEVRFDRSRIHAPSPQRSARLDVSRASSGQDAVAKLNSLLAKIFQGLLLK